MILKLLLARLGRLVVVFVVVTFTCFAMVQRLPGDICISRLGFAAAVPGKLEQCRRDYGLDDSLLVQYFKWAAKVARGDLGVDPFNGFPLWELLKPRATTSVELLFAAVLVSLAIGTPLGMLMAYRAGRRVDQWLSAASYALLSMPAFVLGIIAVKLLAIDLQWLPAIGLPKLREDPVGHLKALILPTVAIAAAQVAVVARVVRTDVIATLQEDFVTMAKSKGLPHRRILVRHVLRPSSFTLVTVAGLQLGQLLGGALVVESLFNLRGYGGLLIQAVTARQSALLMTLVALVVAAFVVLNGLVDATYALLDPRIRRR